LLGGGSAVTRIGLCSLQAIQPSPQAIQLAHAATCQKGRKAISISAGIFVATRHVLSTATSRCDYPPCCEPLPTDATQDSHLQHRKSPGHGAHLLPNKMLLLSRRQITSAKSLRDRKSRSSLRCPDNTTTAAKWTSQTNTNTTPVSKRHKAFASLLVSFLATSSVAIEIDAADKKTIESANTASLTPLPPAPPKAHTRSASGVKASEIRKTRWKRFKYEMGLKMKSGRSGKQKQRSTRTDEMEMESVDVRSQEREEARQEGR
jgi:hypothetical protein